ncbi:MAG: exopolyphosphatase [Bacteroidetes bacterium]|nr:exopolyphosphatase [Bacteroidota bacterium]
MAAIKRVGVIDLGTNTFHLLIVELKDGHPFREIHRERRFIKMAEGGIETIAEAPFQRGLDAMIAFRRILEEKEVDQVRAFGTAALRTASNGAEFVSAVKAGTGLDIELISGDREAELIHKGVAQAVPLKPETDLIMDIGGGSVEFILANQSEVFWARSFPVGVAVLYRNFHKNDPIPKQSIQDLEAYLRETLKPVWQMALKYLPARLIGASGTFDVIEAILAEGKTHPNHAKVDVAPFYPLADQLIQSTQADRLEMDGVPASRADMIVVAILLIREVLNQLNIQQIVISEYAMKEGMIAEMGEVD